MEGISGSSSLLLKEESPISARPGLCWGGFWNSPRMETPQFLWITFVSTQVPSRQRSDCLCSNGTSCVSVCVHCHWAPLKRASVYLLCTVYPPLSCLYTLIPTCLFFFHLRCPSSLSLPSYDGCFCLLIIFVALCWTHSGVFVCFPALKEILILNIFTKAERVSFSYGSVYNSTCRFRFLDGNGGSCIALKKKRIYDYNTIALSNVSEITFQSYIKIEMCKM